MTIAHEENKTKSKSNAKPKGGARTKAKPAARAGEDLSSLHFCTEMVLEDPQASVEHARNELPSNVPAGLGRAGPSRAAGMIHKKWVPGRTLHVRYLDGIAAVQDRVTAIAQEWERHVNINFVFDNSPTAEIRITFAPGGSSSYMGTDCLGIAQNKPTMQYGWLTIATSEAEYRRVVLHEFGHALGLHHEHLSPSVTIPWDKPKVYDYYARTQSPPWTKQQVDFNVLNPINPSDTNYTAFDRDSIMLYSVPEELTIGDFRIDGNGELSIVDRTFMGRWYPYARQNLGLAHTAIVNRESQHLDLFWVGPNGDINSLWWHQGGPWSQPFTITAIGAASSGAIAAVARTSNHLDIFWVAPTGAVMSAWWHEGQPWSAPFAVTGAGAADAGALSVVARESGHLDVFWVAPDGRVMSAWWHEGQPWSAPFAIAPANAAEPGGLAVVARQNNQLDVIWVTPTYGISYSSWHEGQNWTAPVAISGSSSAEVGSLSVVARLSSHLDLFWVNAVGQIMSAWQHEGQAWSAPFVLAPANSAMRPGAVVATARQTNHLDIFWTSPNGALASAWWHDGGGWSAPFSTTAPGVVEERSLTSVARLSNHLDLFWVDSVGEIMTQWWHEAQPWSATATLTPPGKAAL